MRSLAARADVDVHWFSAKRGGGRHLSTSRLSYDTVPGFILSAHLGLHCVLKGSTEVTCSLT